MLYKQILEQFVNGDELCIITSNPAEQRAFQTIMLFDEVSDFIDTVTEEQLQHLFDRLVQLNNNVKV